MSRRRASDFAFAVANDLLEHGNLRDSVEMLKVARIDDTDSSLSAMSSPILAIIVRWICSHATAVLRKPGCHGSWVVQRN